MNFNASCIFCVYVCVRAFRFSAHLIMNIHAIREQIVYDMFILIISAVMTVCGSVSIVKLVRCGHSNTHLFIQLLVGLTMPHRLKNKLNSLNACLH